LNVQWVTIEREQDYQWWECNLANPLIGPFHDGDPHAGWYMLEKKVPASDAYQIPVVVYWSGPTDEGGEIIADCVCQAEVAGRACNADGLWTWISKRPITVEKYDELMEQDFDKYTDLIKSITAACGNI
jgi:hypothetical protein